MLALAVTLLPAAAALVTPGCVIFVRHGQSEFNAANRFTGWINVPLTTEGRAEAAAGANWIEETSISFDVAFSSELQRAQDTAEILLEHCGQGDLPVACDWRLNERHYGALQGLSKDAAVQQYGREQVKAWRNSYTAVPPPMPRSDPGHPANDPLYASVPPASLPDAECLKDTLERCTPFWTERVEPCLRAGRNVLISAHGHSIRALVKHLDDVTDDDIARVSMPNGIPLLYRLRVTSDGALRPVPPSVRSIDACGLPSPLNAQFLGDASELSARLDRDAAVIGLDCPVPDLPPDPPPSESTDELTDSADSDSEGPSMPPADVQSGADSITGVVEPTRSAPSVLRSDV